MTVVLVHGNPETAAVWDPLVAELDRSDVVRLSPPGFGAAVPEGFTATVDGYRDWLVAELESLDGPVDVVGHDWGGGHVVTALLARPALVRSWVSDILGVFDPEYVWHSNALTWQTPGKGEEALGGMLGAPVETRTTRMAGLGLPPGAARAVAEGQDEAMGRCILELYRDAAQPAMARRGAQLDRLTGRPGLAVHASEDRFVGDETMIRRAAGRAGAQVATLDGLGHWWMAQDPARSAAVLRDFWSGVSS